MTTTSPPNAACRSAKADRDGERPPWDREAREASTARGLVKQLERRLLVALDGGGWAIGEPWSQGWGRGLGVLAAGAVAQSGGGGGADTYFAYRDVRGEACASDEAWEGSEERSRTVGAGATVGHLCLLQESAVIQALLERCRCEPLPAYSAFHFHPHALLMHSQPLCTLPPVH
jgi:hypothetical protein